MGAHKPGQQNILLETEDISVYKSFKFDRKKGRVWKRSNKKESGGEKKTVGKSMKSSSKALLGSSGRLRLLKLNQNIVPKLQTATDAQINKTRLRWKNDEAQYSKDSERSLSQEMQLLK